MEGCNDLRAEQSSSHLLCVASLPLCHFPRCAAFVCGGGGCTGRGVSDTPLPSAVNQVPECRLAHSWLPTASLRIQNQEESACKATKGAPVGPQGVLVCSHFQAVPFPALELGSTPHAFLLQPGS